MYPHGSTDSLPFATMGSGSLNAMAVFEAEYKDDMTREEAMALVAKCVLGGTRQLCARAWEAVLLTHTPVALWGRALP